MNLGLEKNKKKKKKKIRWNRCRQRNIAFLCRSNYSRDEVSFFCRLYTLETFCRGKKAREREKERRRKKKEGSLFYHHRKLKTKDRIQDSSFTFPFLPPLFSASPSVCPSAPPRLSSIFGTRLGCSPKNFISLASRLGNLCLFVSLFGFMMLVSLGGSSLFHGNFQSCEIEGGGRGRREGEEEGLTIILIFHLARNNRDRIEICVFIKYTYKIGQFIYLFCF